MNRMQYEARRKEISSRKPDDWDLSSGIAFRMFGEQKATELRALDDEFNPPSRWERFKRRWSW